MLLVQNDCHQIYGFIQSLGVNKLAVQLLKMHRGNYALVLGPFYAFIICIVYIVYLQPVIKLYKAAPSSLYLVYHLNVSYDNNTKLRVSISILYMIYDIHM